MNHELPQAASSYTGVGSILRTPTTVEHCALHRAPEPSGVQGKGGQLIYRRWQHPEDPDHSRQPHMLYCNYTGCQKEVRCLCVRHCRPLVSMISQWPKS